MSAMQERAIELVKTLPEDKVFYLVNILEKMADGSDQSQYSDVTVSQRAYQKLQKFRKPRISGADDYRSELHSAWGQKYAGLD